MTKALLFSRKPARFAAAAAAGRVVPGAGAAVGPLKLTDVDELDPPTAEWVRFRPRLAGICGSDLATIDGRSSQYFEPIVSFPFTPGHEVVGELDDGTRAVLVPVLHCAIRGVDPVCASCATGDTHHCERIAFGHLDPALQSGFCRETGGGWSTAMVAHPGQLVPVPDDMSDEAAVLVEPTACAVHAAHAIKASRAGETGPVAIIGAGTLGLTTLAALRYLDEAAGGNGDRTVIATAKHPEQKRLAQSLGATRA
ncbi:MAG TPA: alcohol dehydrogenase catalytic domain-containing protein, partial [Iamia sp.]